MQSITRRFGLLRISVAEHRGVSMVADWVPAYGSRRTPARHGRRFRAAAFLKVCWDESASTFLDRMPMLSMLRSKSAQVPARAEKNKRPAVAGEQVQPRRHQPLRLRLLRQLLIPKN